MIGWAPDRMVQRLARVVTGLSLVLAGASSAACSATGAAPPGMNLPPRPIGAPTGSEFAASIVGLDLEQRDARIVDEVLRGNVPDRLRTLSKVRVETDGIAVEFWVTPDYLAVGSDADHLLAPMTPRAAQAVADRLGMSLPTPLMVDAIWAAAEVKLTPAPIPPSPEMATVPVFERHSDSVRAQRAAAAAAPSALTAGHKKDVVVTPELASNPGRVAIYGWHEPDGEPIQPLYLGHSDRWVDYSHGIRLVAGTVEVSGTPMDLGTLLRDASLAPLLSHEGVFTGWPQYE